MKNLHLIETNKPSRLFLNKVNNKLLLDSDTYCDLIRMLPSSNYQNIYITSNEEIKEVDWVFNLKSKGVYSIFILNEVVNYEKKIILTTDQDLISDGVQAIDDEFLEWFVNNPSCEEVEVFKERYHVVEFIDDYPKGFFDYQIIIPHEEPCSFCEGKGQIVSSTTISGFKTCDCINIPKEELKQELNLNCFDCNKSLQDCTCIEDTINMKQETLEEAAENYYDIIAEKSSLYGRDEYIAYSQGVQDGVKFQQERRYSEEDMQEYAEYCTSHVLKSQVGHPYLSATKWFEQFKNV